MALLSALGPRLHRWFAGEPSADAQRAHALRRLHLTTHPGQVQALRDLDPRAAVRDLLGRDNATILSEEEIAAVDFSESGDQTLLGWYLERLVDPDAGLHERMTWFWHGHLTSSLARASAEALWRQHHLIRRHALGNFRDLLQEITIDPAMLYWLDGAGSRGEQPNENYAREVMELFALGVENYTEDDVRVAARGLSGWRVDWETLEVSFDREQHYERPLTFRGERRRWNNESIIDKICDDPACAPHVTRAIYRTIVGGEPSPTRLEELAGVFRENDLEIMPLLEAMADHPEFLLARHSRPKSPLEWLVGMVAVLGPADVELDPWWLTRLGHAPFYPPNVAGWPIDDRWVSGTQSLLRTSLLMDQELSDRLIDAVEATVDEVLEHCSLFDVSPSTRAALDEAIRNQPEYERGLDLLILLALTSPEFALA